MVSLRLDKEPRGDLTQTSESSNQDQGAEYLEEEQSHKYLSNKYHNRRDDQLASKEAPLTFGPFYVRELLGCKENFTIEKLIGVCVLVGGEISFTSWAVQAGTRSVRSYTTPAVHHQHRSRNMSIGR